ncbi:hypothetical protein C5167_045605 [Papaver somniferum]|uniref:Proline-rich family protein n=1 Tax=Papaver somniferum TaxID=3469 RepID=A0A4Y7LE52_PAPSO|nr:protein MAINTENANCE OF PSII UNDER HIGH LIGHT 1-like [Papaver somniferum]RZC82818.1 hypothetical protein C5167_045605 [Papaver somniferum]
MSCASKSMLSANSCIFPSSQTKFLKRVQNLKSLNHLSIVRASSSSEDECNVEECAPDKEVGKVSMEWLATEKTQVVGSYPPKKKGWTGYVEKDTAGQTNIYSIEPNVYVAESLISSGTAGTSSEGAANTAGVAAFIALISIAAASSVLIQVSKNKQPPVQTLEYSGPSLTYYINKFKPSETVETTEIKIENSLASQLESSAPSVSEVEPSTQLESSASPVSEVGPSTQLETSAPPVSEVEPQLETSAPSVSEVEPSPVSTSVS